MKSTVSFSLVFLLVLIAISPSYGEEKSKAGTNYIQGTVLLDSDSPGGTQVSMQWQALVPVLSVFSITSILTLLSVLLLYRSHKKSKYIVSIIIITFVSVTITYALNMMETFSGPDGSYKFQKLLTPFEYGDYQVDFHHNGYEPQTLYFPVAATSPSTIDLGTVTLQKNYIKFIKHMGDHQDHEGYSVLQKADNTYVVTGYREINDDEYLFTVRFSELGDIMYTSDIYDSYGHTIHSCSDGGYIICGQTFAYTTWGKIFIVKMSPFFNVQWSAYFSDEARDNGWGARELSNGYVFCGKNQKPNIMSPEYAHVSILDKQGNIKMARDIGEGYAYSLDLTQNEDIVVTGFLGADAFLLKMDSSGNQQWLKTYDYNLHNLRSGKCVKVTSLGGFIMCGSGNIQTNPYKVDLSVLKADSQGNVQWKKTFSYSDRNYAEEIVQTSDNGYVICGRTGTQYFYKMFLLKINSAGKQEWIKIYNELDNSIAHDVAQTSDGGYILTGYDSDGGDKKFVIIKTDHLGNYL